MEPTKVFPIYQLQDAFESFCNSEPSVKTQHRSLYYFLIGYCRRRGNVPRFSLNYESGMHGSAIGSWATYDAALKALQSWGFIHYTPGANRYKVPIVELTFRNPTDDLLMMYWQSYCLSTANPSDDVPITLVVTLKELLNKEKEKIEKEEGGKREASPPDQPPAQPIFAPQPKKLVEVDSALKFFPDQSVVFTMTGFANFLKKMNWSQVDRGVYLPEIQRKAEMLKQERDEVGWENYILDYIKRESAKGSLLTTNLVGVPHSNNFGPAPTATVSSRSYDRKELARYNRTPID